MSSSIDPTPRMGESYICIVKLANRWAPACVRGYLKTFISSDLELDLKVAQSAGKAFAEANNLAFKEPPFLLKHPIFTVLKHDSKWYPGELYSDKLTIIKKIGPSSLEGTQKEATDYANALSLVTRLDFVPSIGPSINTDELQFTKV